MKIFDATAVIAFLKDMDYPEGITKLSEHYEIVVPESVVDEIKKSPGKERLRDLVRKKAVKVVKVDQSKMDQMLKNNPQLHRGECGTIVLMQAYPDKDDACIVSDDSKARKSFQTLNFKWTERLLDIMKERGMIDDETHASKSAKLQNSAFYSRGRRS